MLRMSDPDEDCVLWRSQLDQNSVLCSSMGNKHLVRAGLMAPLRTKQIIRLSGSELPAWLSPAQHRVLVRLCNLMFLIPERTGESLSDPLKFGVTQSDAHLGIKALSAPCYFLLFSRPSPKAGHELQTELDRRMIKG